MTRVLLVGSGAREHAIASALALSSDVELYAAMSSRNPGIMSTARDSQVMKITDPSMVSDYAKKIRAELAVIGPEAPLVSGVANALTKLGIKCVGPTRELALLEGDKAFCRELMNRHDIAGNPVFGVFEDADSTESFIRTVGPVAVKPAGLTGGKGVKISGEDLPSKDSEISYAKEILRNRIGGWARLVVEERLDGEEYSMQAFVDGQDVYAMPLVQDHKRAYENDTGPNTGGMGSYSDRNHLLPFVSPADLEASSQIMTDVVRALRKDTGEEYKGVLYGQFMLARSVNEDRPSPKLIEFNCRFGDPEAMNVLPLLADETSFLEICERIADGNLRSKHASFLQKASVCKYLVPAAYPESVQAGDAISVDEQAIADEGALLFYASVDIRDGKVVTTASRTLALLGIGDTIENAERVSEKATRHVKGSLRHRTDIGTAELIRKRVDHMRSIELTKQVTGTLEAGIR